MLELFDREIYGNPIGAWCLAALLTGAVLIVGFFAKLLLLPRLPAQARGEALPWRTVLRELVERTSGLFLLIAAIYAGLLLVRLPASVHRLFFSIFVVALFLQFALWVDRIVSAALDWRLAPRKTKTAMRNALSLIHFLVRVAVWSFALLLIFENLGFDVTALVAGLGIGGVAVALAAQNVLGDLFSSLAIVLDRPFEVGDSIAFGDDSGTVERIGIKTTRIRSVSGEQIVCANSDLLASRIHNFRRMAERRVPFSLRLPLDTPVSRLERLPVILKNIVEAQELVRFERAHFKSIGDNAFVYEVVYWVLSPDQATYMDIQQAINLAVARVAEREGIHFAHPGKVPTWPEPKERREAAELQRLRAPALR
jgi:small-conductance mechanosensitive channel